MTNETLATIKMRRSVRTFQAKKVSEHNIKQILQAANWAPSAHNQQSWRFIVLQDEKKQALANLVTNKANDFERPTSALLRMAARSITSAPVVIAVANTGDLIKHGMDLFKVKKEMGLDFFRTMEIQSSAAAVENLLLAATSLELATVWLGILYLIKDEVLKFLGEPNGEFMAVIPVGYADKTGKGPKKRNLDVAARYLS
ncbi:nitroreductase family protein [bacterium]|jgi:nitroreductase|nr:nitroreductase family protein [bacterium]MBT4552056.1 nitroreductase family protein [bacterium]MBT7088209.1 nitroreductase family protein [bacterium]